ncbi:hypothetical protein JCM19239_6821 [Vibrio variabilis]|uniref:Uncharacterized protein n=1 Tax=Vibrio variabilis TaxID=990271 RepID=A0ABQ0JN52_9VIBR|nr:hypothetical protein JCM19239_6821 [Vibrio variabilis]
MFETFYENYPAHRRLSEDAAANAWNEADLSDEDIQELLDWLRARQESDPSWHKAATGMYVPRLDKFLRQCWWRTERGNRRPTF